MWCLWLHYYHYANFLRHKRTHTGEKPFKCNVCDYSAAQQSALVKHQTQRTHTGEKPFKCNVFDYSAATHCALLKHQRIHTGEKSFKCNACDYSATEQSHLLKHQIKHTGKKKHLNAKWGITSGKVFVWLLWLSDVHFGDIPQKCYLCDYSSVQYMCTKIHFTTHTGDKPYSWPQIAQMYLLVLLSGWRKPYEDTFYNTHWWEILFIKKYTLVWKHFCDHCDYPKFTLATTVRSVICVTNHLYSTCAWRYILQHTLVINLNLDLNLLRCTY